jgi:hypothetical protein
MSKRLIRRSRQTVLDTLLNQFVSPHSLGDVIETLRAADTRGIAYSSVSCPLAAYLTTRAGFPILVRNGEAYDPTDRHVVATLPRAAADFVRTFDAGWYPEFELPRSTATTFTQAEAIAAARANASHYRVKYLVRRTLAGDKWVGEPLYNGFRRVI